MSKTDETIGQLYSAAQDMKERLDLAIAIITQLKTGELSLDRIELKDGGFTLLPPPEEEEENMRVLRG